MPQPKETVMDTTEKATHKATNSPQPTVLMVDDDDDIRYAISRILKKCECEVMDTDSVENAIDILSTTHFDLVFSDLRFHNGLGGENLLQYCTTNLPNTGVILISCAMDAKTRKNYIEMGAIECLQKPFFKDTCIEVIENFYFAGKRAA